MRRLLLSPLVRPLLLLPVLMLALLISLLSFQQQH